MIDLHHSRQRVWFVSKGESARDSAGQPFALCFGIVTNASSDQAPSAPCLCLQRPGYDPSNGLRMDRKQNRHAAFSLLYVATRFVMKITPFPIITKVSSPVGKPPPPYVIVCCTVATRFTWDPPLLPVFEIKYRD